MKINPYLTFSGQCEEAMKFYAKVLGGKLELMPFEGTPGAEHVPADYRKKIMHACLNLGDFSLMASDSMPGQKVDMSGMSVALHPEKPAEAERIFKALSENGKITMQLAETFWSPRFGMLVDRFGTPWMVNCVMPQ